MLKRFFSRLRSSKDAKSEREKNKKPIYFWKTRKGKLGLGISAAILLIVVILFNKQIDDLLRLWGIKAQNDMGQVSVEIVPADQTVYPNQPYPANIAQYDIVLKPEQESWWIDQGGQLIDITIDEVYVYLTNSDVAPYIEDADQFTQLNDPLPPGKNILAGQTSLSFFDDTWQTIPFNIKTLGSLGEDEIKQAQFEVYVRGHHKFDNPGEPGGERTFGVPFPLLFTLVLSGAPLVDFSLLITDPVDKGENRIIKAGSNAHYTVTVQALGEFSGLIDLSIDGFEPYMGPEGAITSIDFPAQVYIEPGDPYPLELVVHTNLALDHPVDIYPFVVTGTTDTGSSLLTHSDSGWLHIVPRPYFQVYVERDTTVAYARVNAEDELITWPGGEIQYTVRLERFHWSGQVNVEVSWRDSVEKSLQDIVLPVTFGNGGVFPASETAIAYTTLTMSIREDAIAEDLTFGIVGSGDLDGDPTTPDDVIYSENTALFHIIDFTIEIKDPTVVSVSDGGTANYEIYLVERNGFNTEDDGYIQLDIVPSELELQALYGNQIESVTFSNNNTEWLSTDDHLSTTLSIKTGLGCLPTLVDGIKFNVKADYMRGRPPLVESVLSRTSNEGTLHIMVTVDFSVTLIPHGEPDSFGRDTVTYPDANTDYTVRVDRFHNFEGEIAIELIAVDYALYFYPPEYADGSNIFYFDNLNPITQTKEFTLRTKDTAALVDISFVAQGSGDIDGDEEDEIRTSDPKIVGITNFEISIALTDPGFPNEPGPPPTYILASRSPEAPIRQYTVTITSLNSYVGSVTLTHDFASHPDWWIDVIEEVKWEEFSAEVVLNITANVAKTVILTVKIQDNIPPPTTPPWDLDFTVTGTDLGALLYDNTHLSHSTMGRLRIIGPIIDPGFRFSMDYESSTSNPGLDPLLNNTAIPYGTITYKLTVFRDGGWTGVVNTTVMGLNPGVVVDRIDYTNTFDNKLDTEIHYLVIYIKETAPAIAVNFSVVATGPISPFSITDSATFNVIDYTITVGPQSLAIEEGYTGEITYPITASPLNLFRGIINLTSNLIKDNGIEDYTFDNNSLALSPGVPVATTLRLVLNNIAEQIRNFKVTGTDSVKTDRNGNTFDREGDGQLIVDAIPLNPSFYVDLAIDGQPYLSDPDATISYVATPGETRTIFKAKVVPSGGFGTDQTVIVNLSRIISPNWPDNINELSFRDQRVGGTVIDHLDFNSEEEQEFYIYADIKDPLVNTNSIDLRVVGTTTSYGGLTDTSRLAWINFPGTPNYSLSINPNYDYDLHVNAGQTAHYTVTITRSLGYNDNINLAITDLSNIDGMTSYYFDDGNTPDAKTITISSGTNTTDITFETDINLDHNVLDTTFNVEGYGGSAPGEHSVTSRLSIDRLLHSSFTVTLHGTTVGEDPIHNVTPGQAGVIYTVEVTPVDVFIGRVTLSHSITDSYVSLATFASDHIDFYAGDIAKTTTLTVVTFATAQSDHNPITFTVSGQSSTIGPISSNIGTLNIITVPNFYLEITDSPKSALIGKTVYYTLVLHRQNGFNSAVNITGEYQISDIDRFNFRDTNDGLGNIVTSFPASNTPTQTLYIEVRSYGNIDDQDDSAHSEFTVRGVDATGGIVEPKTVDGMLEITDFQIIISADDTVIRGLDKTFTVRLSRYNGFTRAITLTYSIAPEFMGNFDVNPWFGAGGNTYVFPANTANQLTTLTFSTSIGAILTTVPFSVTGTDNISTGFSGQTRSDSGNLTIIDNTPGTPDFTISIAPESRTVEPGGNTTYTITVTRLNGFSEDISLFTDLLTKNPNDILQVLFVADPSNPGITTLQVMTKDTARNSTTPIVFNVFGIASITRSDSADLIIYKYTGGGGGGGGGGGDPVIPPTPPTTPIVPPVVPPIEAPKVPEVEIPEALPSTGPEMWLWLGIIALIFIGTNQVIGRDRDAD